MRDLTTGTGTLLFAIVGAVTIGKLAGRHIGNAINNWLDRRQR